MEDQWTKSEVIAQDPMKHVLTVIEKKVRNLDKRKVKLDSYRKILTEGGMLDPDQEIAVNKYNEVVGSINFAKELLQGFTFVADEITKARRKVEKKELMQREDSFKQMAQYVVKVENVLKLLFNCEKVRSDLLKGDKKLLAEEECEQLLQFYETCIMPSTTPKINFLDNINDIGNYLLLTYDASHEAVCGTTYHHIHQVMDRLLNSEFFLALPCTEQTGPKSPGHDEVKQLDSLHHEEHSSSVQSCESPGKVSNNSSADHGNNNYEDTLSEKNPNPEIKQHVDCLASKHGQLSVEDVLSEVRGEYSFFQESLISEPDLCLRPTTHGNSFQEATKASLEEVSEIQFAAYNEMKESPIAHSPNLENVAPSHAQQPNMDTSQTHIPLPHEKQSGYQTFQVQLDVQNKSHHDSQVIGAGDASNSAEHTVAVDQTSRSVAAKMENMSTNHKSGFGSTKYGSNVPSTKQLSTMNSHRPQPNGHFHPSTNTNRQYSNFDKNYFLNGSYSNASQFSNAYQDINSYHQ
uniref:Rngi RNA granule protein invertebrate uncharacterized LOC100179738 n=1 Tax=Phallusia mammillata TaxID=59560 RepID=A0A6F9D8X2_9ASCI|nr:rngi RNA granule protein invertebrate uncharacterized LOC100179738 [Phallusia mammillata]